MRYEIFDVCTTNVWDACGMASKAMMEFRERSVKIDHRMLPNSEREVWIIWVSKDPLNVRKEEDKKES